MLSFLRGGSALSFNFAFALFCVFIFLLFVLCYLFLCLALFFASFFSILFFFSFRSMAFTCFEWSVVCYFRNLIRQVLYFIYVYLLLTNL
jgi:hypothetical protein